jgi:hypothetical protein
MIHASLLGTVLPVNCPSTTSPWRVCSFIFDRLQDKASRYRNFNMRDARWKTRAEMVEANRRALDSGD